MEWIMLWTVPCCRWTIDRGSRVLLSRQKSSVSRDVGGTTGVNFLLHAAKFQRDGRNIEAARRDSKELHFDTAGAVVLHTKIGGALLTPRVNLTPQTWVLVLS